MVKKRPMKQIAKDIRDKVSKMPTEDIEKELPEYSKISGRMLKSREVSPAHPEFNDMIIHMLFMKEELNRRKRQSVEVKIKKADPTLIGRSTIKHKKKRR